MTQSARASAKTIQSILAKQKPGFVPRLAIAIGSGSGDLANHIKDPIKIPYHDLTGFPELDVEGHESFVLLGHIKKTPVICLKGRAHFYEGFENEAVLTMVRTCKLLGCDTWLVTNASGSFHKNMGPGSLVAIKDHINFQFRNVLVGPNDNEFGDRFIPMDTAYDADYRKALQQYAKSLDITLHEGVYVGVIGPAFETPAEINAYRILGADLVGMSTIPEITAAKHCGMRTAAIAVITNFAAGMHDIALSHDVTLAGAKLGMDSLTQLLLKFIEHSFSPTA